MNVANLLLMDEVFIFERKSVTTVNTSPIIRVIDSLPQRGIDLTLDNINITLNIV